MFGFVCVGGWDRGVGEAVVVSMGTRLLTAAIHKGEKQQYQYMRLWFD